MARRIHRAGSPAVRNGERGASLVEFALLLPVFAALLLGMFTGGHAYFRKITIDDSVREGARYGATLEADTTNLPTSASAWETDVRNRVASSSGGELDPATEVCARLVEAGDEDPTNWSCGVANPPGVLSTQVLAKVSASKGVTFDFLFGSRDITLTSRSVARYERAGS